MQIQSNQESSAAMIDEAGAFVPAEKSPRNWLRIRLLVLLGVTIVCALIFLPVKEILVDLLEWAKGLGYWACLVYIAACILLIPLFLPVTALSLTAGSLFGIPLGAAVMATGVTLGASTSFLIARYLAQRAVTEKIGDNKTFHLLDRAVTREGFKIVLLSRLTPIFPFKLLNYTYGLTSIPFRWYLLATWLGCIPGAIFYVYLGTTTADVAKAAAGNEEADGGMLGWKIFILVVTIIITWTITRIARRAMKEALPETAKG